MSRTVTVSTAVFAAIWANRRDGEETENTILSRMLGCSEEARANETAATGDGGVHDSRNNVHFPESFEVFRNYKGKEYKAIAKQGGWLREDTGERYPTLNQLNNSIVSGNENIWNGNWKYRAPEGTRRPIDTLRS